VFRAVGFLSFVCSALSGCLVCFPIPRKMRAIGGMMGIAFHDPPTCRSVREGAALDGMVCAVKGSVSVAPFGLFVVGYISPHAIARL